MRLPPIQEAIHWLEVGTGARALRLVVGALALLVLTLWFDFHQMRNFTAPDAMEAAQLARNLSRGEGFTTEVVRPLTIQWVDQTQGLPARLNRQAHPDLFNPPLYPLLLAGWMKVMPFDYATHPPFWRYQPEMLIALFNQLLFFASVWLMYRLGRRLISGEAGVLLAILLLASELLWRFSVSGHSTMLALLLGVCLLWVLALLEEAARTRQRRLKWFVLWGGFAGLVLGLLALTRYATLVLLVPVTLFYVFFMDRRAMPAMLATWVVCAAVVTPWLARNHHLSGTFFGVPGTAIYQETPRFPGTRLERSFEPDLEIVGMFDYFRKGSEGLRTAFANDLLKPGGGWFGAFFLVGLVGRFRNPAMNRMRVFLFLSLAVFAVAQALGRTHLSTFSPTINSENLLALLTPGMFLVGVGFYYWLIEKLELPFREFRHVISSFLVFGTGVPLLLGFLPPRVVPIAYPPYYPPHLQEVSQFLEPREMLLTDMPWATAWYGDRQSVWIPLDEHESFFRIHDEHKKVSGLLLTPLTTDAAFRRDILQGRDFAWGRFALEVMLRKNVTTGFPLRQAWTYGMPDHLFLSDRARWQEPPAGSPPEASDALPKTPPASPATQPPPPPATNAAPASPPRP